MIGALRVKNCVPLQNGCKNVKVCSVTLTLLASNFRLHLSSAFCFKQTINWKEVYIFKLVDWMSNNIDLDEKAHYEPSHLDLHCL